MFAMRLASRQFCAVARRKGVLVLCLALCTLGLSGSASGPSFTTFDPPGSRDTFTALHDGINPAGAISGFFFDASFVNHSYVRAADGTITTFDPPGAASSVATGINPAGTIAGITIDASNSFHGYVRAADGTSTAFDVPEAGTGSFQGTNSVGINAAGAIEGWYFDASSVSHGFIRNP